jgi:hypothetical protein
VSRSNQTVVRPLGTPRLPRRRFVPPTAVRVAQFCLVTRIAFVIGLLLTAGLAAAPTNLVLSGFGRVSLPDGATWRGLAVWIFAAAVVETTLVVRLGRLRAGSRRTILLVESLVIALSGLYAAAGLKIALVPLVGAIAGVVLLRLDHVRHSFDRARAERRLLWQTIPAVLYEGYALPEPTAVKEVQRIGYRADIDARRVEAGPSEMSRA